GCNLCATLQHRPCLRKRVDQHSGPYAGEVMQLDVHIDDDTEIAATTAQGPEQFLLLTMPSRDDPAVGENNIRAEQIVERQPKPPKEGAVAATKSEASHPHGTARACNRSHAERFDGAQNL